MRGVVRTARLLLAGLLLAGCELEEVTLAEPHVDLLVVEGLVQLGLPAPGGGAVEVGRMSAFLHRTVRGPFGFNAPEPGARVEVTRSDGVVYRLAESFNRGDCVSSTPISGTGSCYILSDEDLASLPPLRPGDSLRLRVETVGGELIEAQTTVPGDFHFHGPRDQSVCTIPADESFPLHWSGSEGARAYVSETQIYGLRAALEPLGIWVVYDPLFLSGLSISATDTSIAFPEQFGVFERFGLDREVALVLQRGLPPSTWAELVVSAVDQNYVNWIRGGNFNPSGSIRIPSVEGDGTGYFGSSVSQWLELLVNPAPGGGVYLAPACSPPG